MAREADFFAEALGCRRSLLKLAVRLTRNPGDAEDLVQETYARAFRAWHTYREGTHCRAWLARILENCFVSQCRQQERFRRWVEREAPAQVTDSEHAVTWSSLSDRTARALGRLPGDFRAVVVLHDLQGSSYREIARRIGIPMGTVMSRLHRARRQLFRALSPHAREFGLRTAA